MSQLRTHQMEKYARGLLLIGWLARLVSPVPIDNPYPPGMFCACCHRELNDHTDGALMVCARVLDEERFWTFVLQKPMRDLA